MLLAKWLGSGKRVKRGRQGRGLALYGMRWKLREKKKLTAHFIELACLNEKGIFDAIVLSLQTDFGLMVRVKGEHKFRSGPLSARGEEMKRELEMTEPERLLMAEQKERDDLAKYMSAMAGVTVEAEPIDIPEKKEDEPPPPVDPVDPEPVTDDEPTADDKEAEIVADPTEDGEEKEE